MRFKSLLLLTILFLISFLLQGQSIVLKQSIFFKSGQFYLSKNKVAQLKTIIEKIKENAAVSILLEGNSDNVGNYKSNKKLSERRALAIKKYLFANGIAENLFTIIAIGSDKPIASNQTVLGRKQNRRVDIIIATEETFQKAIKELDNISNLYKQLETPLQKFCINANKDTTIRCKQGTVIYIKANSFKQVGNCNCVSFGVKEDYLNSDMVLDNLTTTSNGKLLETQGMVYTEALDCDGKKLQLNKDLVILIPTDTIRKDAKIFDGNRDHNEVMNWTINNNAVLSNFTLKEIDSCNNINCIKEEDDCERCRFFFCRIGRIGKATKGIFDENTRNINKQFRQCQQKFKKKKAAKTNTEIFNKINALNSCDYLKQLFEKYGVKNVDELMLAINKPLLEKYNVATLDALRDTLKKETIQKIEMDYMDKKISFEDYKYYIFNTSNLGWSNVDCFAGNAKNGYVKINVNLTPEINTVCKLIFKSRRTIIDATKVDLNFEFEGVPKGEEAWLVAIKYVDGKPYLSLKEMTTQVGTYEVNFEVLTLQALKEKLKILNSY